jgi:hypothetical protein
LFKLKHDEMCSLHEKQVSENNQLQESLETQNRENKFSYNNLLQKHNSLTTNYNLLQNTYSTIQAYQTKLTN